MTPPPDPPRVVPRPPTRPQDFECCNRGCCPCIFDYYYDALERWEARIEEMGLDPKVELAKFEAG